MFKQRVTGAEERAGRAENDVFELKGQLATAQIAAALPLSYQPQKAVSRHCCRPPFRSSLPRPLHGNASTSFIIAAQTAIHAAIAIDRLINHIRWPSHVA